MIRHKGRDYYKTRGEWVTFAAAKFMAVTNKALLRILEGRLRRLHGERL